MDSLSGNLRSRRKLLNSWNTHLDEALANELLVQRIDGQNDIILSAELDKANACLPT